MPIGKDHVLYVQNGDPAVIRVVNVVTNVTEREIALQTKHPSSTHGQFRHARLTDRGTLLVAHMDLDKVVEYDYNGNELWSFPGNAWNYLWFNTGDVPGLIELLGGPHLSVELASDYRVFLRVGAVHQGRVRSGRHISRNLIFQPTMRRFWR